MGRFKGQLFGYNKHEVDEDIAELEQTIKQQAEQLAHLKEQLNSTKDQMDYLIQRNDITQKTNEEIARLALKEASSLIDKAKRNANMILKESMDYVKGLDNEVNGFKDEAKQFRAQVVKISEELLETLDNSEIFSLIKEENTKKETDHTQDL